MKRGLDIQQYRDALNEARRQHPFSEDVIGTFDPYTGNPIQTERDYDAFLRARVERELNAAGGPPPSKSSRGPIVAIVLLAIALLAVSSLGASFYITSQAQAAEIQKLSDELDTAQADLATAKLALKDVQNTLADTVAELDQAVEDYEETLDLYSYAIDELTFFDVTIGFIDADAYDYLYHTSFCTEFQNAEYFFAHNVEYCEYLGYSSCPLCH